MSPNHRSGRVNSSSTSMRGWQKYAAQVDQRLDGVGQRPPRPQNLTAQLAKGLDGTGGPTALLALERSQLRRYSGRRRHVRQIETLPTVELGAVTQVQIFAQRVDLPAARVVDADARHRPAVPLKPKNQPLRWRTVCSTTKWPSRARAWAPVSIE